MNPRILGYRTFAEISDEMAQKHHGEWWRARRDDYLEALIRDHWLGRFMDNAGQSCVFDLANRGAPTSVTRHSVWRLLGDGKPQTVCEVRGSETPPWKTLAAAKREEYGGNVVQGILEKLGLSEADARAWMEQYDEENSPRVQLGTQHTPSVEPDPYRTGAAGRPTCMHLILAEFDRRAEANDIEAGQKVSAEARSLREWAMANHPTAPIPSADTIENTIRKPFRRHRSDNPTKTPTK